MPLFRSRLATQPEDAATAPFEAAALEEAPAAVVPEDEVGFADLVRRHQGMVYGVAWHFLRNAAEAEELSQEVFLALYRHRAKIVSAEHLAAWLRQVASRKCLDRRRRPAMQELPQELTAPDSGSADPWISQKLQNLVAELAPHPRLVIILRYQQEMTPEEITRATGFPLATVKSHLRRSLARLRQQWNEAGAPV